MLGSAGPPPTASVSCTAPNQPHSLPRSRPRRLQGWPSRRSASPTSDGPCSPPRLRAGASPGPSTGHKLRPRPKDRHQTSPRCFVPVHHQLRVEALFCQTDPQVLHLLLATNLLFVLRIYQVPHNPIQFLCQHAKPSGPGNFFYLASLRK